MPSNRITLTAIPLLLPLLWGINQVVHAAELATLFTTPAERQLINSNRYKSNDDETPRPVAIESAPQPIQQLVQEEVAREYRVSGITISSEGAHTVWINGVAYEDGEQLEDKSRVRVLVGNEIRIRITTPDGKNHFATSGETLEVTYLAPLQN
jgi:hypothetical protein